MKNKLATLVGALALSAAASAQTWIWYPGDYEIWLSVFQKGGKKAPRSVRRLFIRLPSHIS